MLPAAPHILTDREKNVQYDTGHVLITAEHRPPGHGPKCAVCREVITSGEACIKMRAQRNPSSQFFMHIGCGGGVMFNLMRAFNYGSNGLGAGHTAKPLLLGEGMGPIKFKGFVKGGPAGQPLELAPKKEEVSPKKAKRGPGRPKGSKNKPKKRPVGRPPAKRGPGRPPGSKNKPKKAKRGPGRPKGSKNKPKK